MFDLFLLLLLTGAALAVFFWAGTLFFQGFIYTEPSEQLAWRAPVAAVVLTLFLGLWCLLDVGVRGSTPTDLPYNTIFRFSPRVEMNKDPVKRLWVVKTGGKDEVEYKLHKTPVAAGQVNFEYQAAGSNKPWNKNGIEAIILEHDGAKIRFEPATAQEGAYRRFVGDGWEMVEYEMGPTGQPVQFRLGRFVANLLLNGFHLGLWFVCLWLVLRFQWSHALGLGFVLWLVATLTFVPGLLGQAGTVAWQGPPSQSASLNVSLPLAI